MIHLECGSGWCASQGTPDRDCGDGRSPACSPNPAGLGPQGVPPPTFSPSVLPLGCRTPGRGAPRCPASPPPFKPVASQGAHSTANLEIRLWAGGGAELREAREYCGTSTRTALRSLLREVCARLFSLAASIQARGHRV